MADQPRVTIVSYAPETGTAPLKVRAAYEAEAGSGPITELQWLVRASGTTAWSVAARNPPDDPDHTYTLQAGEWEIALKAIGPGGEGQTLKRRLIRVAQPGAPVDDVVPLPTYDQFITVEGPQVDAAYGARVTLADAAHTAWRRLNENWSHENILRDIRHQPTVGLVQRVRITPPTYEQWMHDDLDALVGAFRAMRRIMSTGDVRHLAWRRFLENWTTVNLVHDIKGEPLETPRVPPARRGLVRAAGNAVADDDGAFLALGATCFWLAWGWRHDRSRLERNLLFLREHGVDYIRALGVVGPSHWSDRTIDANWPDYPEVIAGATDLAYECGLRVQWTIFGGVDTTPSSDSRRQLVDRFLAAIAGREAKIFAIEIANEGWQNGFPGDAGLTELRDLGGRVRARVPNLVALTAPIDGDNESEVCRVYGGWPGAATLHYQRKPGNEGPWRPVRQPWGYPDEYRDREGYSGPMPAIALNNEPIGPQSSNDAEDDPLRIVMAFVSTFVAKNSAYVWHAGPGIRGGGAEDLAAGRSANFDELPRAVAHLSAIAAARDYLPADLSNWERQNAHWSGHPFDGFTAAVDEGRIVRSNASVRGGSFFVTVLGLRESTTVRPKQACEIDILNPISGEVLRTTRLAAGEALTLDIPGGRVSDWARATAYVIRGRVVAP